MNIVVIGFGAIASYVSAKLSEDSDVVVACVLCRQGRDNAAVDALGAGVKPINTVDDIPGDTDLVIECAGHAALAEYGPAVLQRGIDLMCTSNGALAQPELADRLSSAAQAGGSRLQLVSGAIGAIDAIAAAKVGDIDRIVYRGRKPPQGWKGSPAEDAIDLDNLDGPACHFSGSAREAALRYPKNANVAATVALAGSGLDETRVELVADPTIIENIHEIEVEGTFGRLQFRIDGKPLPGNPKSSALTAMSVVAAVRNRMARIKM
ncbi:aspartate dehydrogenase [Anderseniella sp. Alg231-50]|uniref:aspartate dehydrogenase n=1 Tax=Anderseniella sp. Alg231-50 TaxID=1922226 RepID=UPI000D553647